MSSGIYEDAGRMDALTEFYRNYYRDEIGELANAYPRDVRSLAVDWSDLYRAMPDFADDFLKAPHGADEPNLDPLHELHEALQQTDLPIEQDFTHDKYENAHVRVRLPPSERIGIGSVRSRHRGRYIAIEGQVERVSQQTEYVKFAAFECSSCSSIYEEPQPRDQLNDPGSCPGKGCSGKPAWDLVPEQCRTVDLRTLQLKQPPEEASGSAKSLTVYLEDDLAFADGDRSLPDMAGERVTVHGILKRDLSQTRGRNGRPMFDAYMDADVLEFENGIGRDIDLTEHRETIEVVADSDDPMGQLIESFAPNVAGGRRIRQIKRAAILYLFGGYRKSMDDGTTYRGDPHLLLVGDPATGKSSILNYIERVSPRVERLSGTDSTGVGLTAAAEQTEGGEWVLKPGMLPRASGGHAIVDELDKMSGAEENLHEALEEQRVHVSKAGMKATLKTETGLVAAANPRDGRFGEYDNVLEEVDVEPALFSRFDLLHTLRDEPDADTDEAVAETTLSGWQDASAADGDTEPTVPDVPVPPATMQAYIGHAKQLTPTLSDEAKDRLKNFYTEQRGKYDGDNVPITARANPAGARLAEASARIRLSETVTAEDADLAIDAIRAMMGDVFLNEDLQPDADRVTGARQSGEKYDQLKPDVLDTLNRDGPMVPDELARMLSVDEQRIRDALAHYKERGDVIERQGRWETP